MNGKLRIYKQEDNLVLSTEFESWKFRAVALRRSEGFESPFGRQFTLSTQLIKPNYLVVVPPTQHHSFFRNLPPLLT